MIIYFIVFIKVYFGERFLFYLSIFSRPPSCTRYISGLSHRRLDSFLKLGSAESLIHVNYSMSMSWWFQLLPLEDAQRTILAQTLATQSSLFEHLVSVEVLLSDLKSSCYPVRIFIFSLLSIASIFVRFHRSRVKRIGFRVSASL